MTELFNFEGYDIPVRLVEMTGGGPESFKEISDWHIALLQREIGIKADDNIVEIGCGIGRDAIPLTTILNGNGSYLGTDVIQPSIEWCQNSITPRFPNFEFVWHNIADDLHNPDGDLDADDVVLPVADGSTDLIILQSVFTHMFEDEIVHYLKEFYRVLKPGGRVWASVFIVDKDILGKVRESAPTQYALAFPHALGNGTFFNTAGSPRGAVAFTRKRLDKMMAVAGLELVRPPLKGSWSGCWDQPEFGQDVLIMAKKS